MELRNALGAAFGLQLPATVTFDYPTVDALAGYVSGQLAAAAGGDGWLSDCSSAGSAGGWLPGSVSDRAGDLTTDLVGVGCIFPGASGSNAAVSAAGFGAFWAAAAAGANLQRPVPHQRWDLEWFYSTEPALGKSYARFAAWEEVGVPAAVHRPIPVARLWAGGRWPKRARQPTCRVPCLPRRAWTCLTRRSSDYRAPRPWRSTRRPVCCCVSLKRRLWMRVRGAVAPSGLPTVDLPPRPLHRTHATRCPVLLLPRRRVRHRHAGRRHRHLLWLHVW